MHLTVSVGAMVITPCSPWRGGGGREGGGGERGEGERGGGVRERVHLASAHDDTITDSPRSHKTHFTYTYTMIDLHQHSLHRVYIAVYVYAHLTKP